MFRVQIYQYQWVPWSSMLSMLCLMVTGCSLSGCVTCTTPWTWSSPPPPSSTLSVSQCTGGKNISPTSSPKYFILLRWCQIVAFPASYQEYFGRQVVFSLIVGIWVVSFIIAFVPIFTNIYTTQHFLHTRDHCKCEFINILVFSNESLLAIPFLYCYL